MSLLFNMLSRLVITFLPRSKHLSVKQTESQRDWTSSWWLGDPRFLSPHTSQPLPGWSSWVETVLGGFSRMLNLHNDSDRILISGRRMDLRTLQGHRQGSPRSLWELQALCSICSSVPPCKWVAILHPLRPTFLEPEHWGMRPRSASAPGQYKMGEALPWGGHERQPMLKLCLQVPFWPHACSCR